MRDLSFSTPSDVQTYVKPRPVSFLSDTQNLLLFRNRTRLQPPHHPLSRLLCWDRGLPYRTCSLSSSRGSRNNALIELLSGLYEIPIVHAYLNDCSSTKWGTSVYRLNYVQYERAFISFIALRFDGSYRPSSTAETVDSLICTASTPSTCSPILISHNSQTTRCYTYCAEQAD
ncbi:hypothetical protein ARMGADRAFT_256396 [Armillaria gallica]|uniref:Uncharacterized protein n=1 Tax=Armillaria gallica TaxID=47427 RepID=A0A2H3E7Z6_ARMGA|nr:hypothetical protein ARMGADRAFT_256396 [Armillaria gallica]